MTDPLSTARKTILTERDALTLLAEQLDTRFIHAIETIEQTSAAGGRVIVTGVGKSGHIGRKIAAIMASTGTPALYVHPSEASHGDMGMITEADTVIAISNSGEAPELGDMISYCRRFAIPLLAITSKPASTLAQHANIVLQLPDVPEAEPNGMAPTTSTATTMAMGDALAITLLERRGLTLEQYSIFHPGGKLGKRLKKVADIMTPTSQLPIISPTCSMEKAVLVMTQTNIGCVIIENDDGSIAGIITDGDLKRHMSPELLSQKVTDIMTPNPKAISPNALAVEAVEIMANRSGTPITSLLVTENERLLGLLRLQTCLQAGII